MKFIKLSLICITSCFASISCASTFTKLNSSNSSTGFTSNEVNEEEYCYLSFNAEHYTINNHVDKDIKIIKNKDNVCFTVVHDDEYKPLTEDQIKEENNLPFLFDEDTQVITIKRMTTDYSFTIKDEEHINYMFTFKGNHCRARVDGTQDSYETVLNIDISELGNAPRLNLKCDDGFTFDKSTTEIQVYLDDVKSTNYDLFVDETFHDKADIVAYGRWKNVFIYVSPKGTEPAPTGEYTLTAMGVNCVSDNEDSQGKTMFIEKRKKGDKVELLFKPNVGFQMPEKKEISVVASNLEEQLDFTYLIDPQTGNGSVAFTYPECNVSVIVPCKASVKKKYYVNYVDNIGGVSNMPQMADIVEEGSTTSKPTETPTLNGFEFKYWSDNKDTKTEFDFDQTKINKNINLYPIFEKSAKKFINFKYDKSKVLINYDGEVIDTYVYDGGFTPAVAVDPSPLKSDLDNDILNEFLDFKCFIDNKLVPLNYNYNSSTRILTLNNPQTCDILISFKHIDEVSWDFIGKNARNDDLQFFMKPGDVKRTWMEGNCYDVVYLGARDTVDANTKKHFNGLGFEFNNVLCDKNKNLITSSCNNSYYGYFHESECYSKINSYMTDHVEKGIFDNVKKVTNEYATVVGSSSIPSHVLQYSNHDDTFFVADFSDVSNISEEARKHQSFPYYDLPENDELRNRRIKYDCNGNPVNYVTLRTPYYVSIFLPNPNPYMYYTKAGNIDSDFEYQWITNKFYLAPMFIF